jgi:hypothetical protein
MTVTLSAATEEYVRAQMETGAFASPEEVIEALVRLKPPVVCHDRAGKRLTQEELEGELLMAVRGPHEPWRGREELAEMAARIRER